MAIIASTMGAWQEAVSKKSKRKGTGNPVPSLFMIWNCLLNVDGLAVGIERSLDPDFLAFVLLQSFLVIDIVGLAAGVLQDVLVTGLRDGAAERLTIIGRLLSLCVASRLAG